MVSLQSTIYKDNINNGTFLNIKSSPPSESEQARIALWEETRILAGRGQEVPAHREGNFAAVQRQNYARLVVEAAHERVRMLPPIPNVIGQELSRELSNFGIPNECIDRPTTPHDKDGKEITGIEKGAQWERLSNELAEHDHELHVSVMWKKTRILAGYITRTSDIKKTPPVYIEFEDFLRHNGLSREIASQASLIDGTRRHKPANGTNIIPSTEDEIQYGQMVQPRLPSGIHQWGRGKFPFQRNIQCSYCGIFKLLFFFNKTVAAEVRECLAEWRSDGSVHPIVLGHNAECNSCMTTRGPHSIADVYDDRY
ncbi:hypothetical protein EAE96_003162 [Botrytis aclada]|nr:hypothetical protein EAE96_003162 [Botrytis aclada]